MAGVAPSAITVPTYSYNHFCRLYKDWASVLQPSMRQTHIAGRKLFVDYCGQTTLHRGSFIPVDPLSRAGSSSRCSRGLNYTFA